MTFKEVWICYNAIIKRRTEELKFQARVMGAEIKEDAPEAEPLTEQQNALIDRCVEEQIKMKGLKRWRTN
jgi:hypothetical protein